MIKRVFDTAFSVFLLVLLCIPILMGWMLASYDTRSNGFFLQKRIGKYGVPFTIFKLKTIRETTDSNEKRISALGNFFRKYKIDELPQLVNILLGEMSFVGPRPDIPGYYDLLTGENRDVLKLKPGLTSEASLKYFNEAQILAKQENPKQYNDDVIFPDKIKMNLEYLQKKSFRLDLQIILKTLLR